MEDYLSRERGRVHGTLSLYMMFATVPQGCHAAVVRDKVLGHGVAIAQRRGTVVGESPVARALAQIKVLQQPRLLQCRWRWRKRSKRWWQSGQYCSRYIDARKKAADGAGTRIHDHGSRDVDDATLRTETWKSSGKIGFWSFWGSRQSPARRRPSARGCGPYIRPGVLLRGNKVHILISLELYKILDIFTVI